MAKTYADLLQEVKAAIRQVSLEDLKDRLDSGEELILVDVREKDEWRQGHVPGALNLPPAEAAARVPELADALASAEAVVVYCHGVECSDAIGVAERLLEVIPEPVYVFEAGLKGWIDAGHPVNEGMEP